MALFFIILLNINGDFVKKMEREGVREREREREREYREDIALGTICRSLIFFMCPLYNISFLPFYPAVFSAFSFHPLSLSLFSNAFLDILFACGLVTAGRGELRARGESTSRGYSNFECVCPECKIHAVAVGTARSRHPPCSRKEMSRHYCGS